MEFPPFSVQRQMISVFSVQQVKSILLDFNNCKPRPFTDGFFGMEQWTRSSARPVAAVKHLRSVAAA